MKIIKPIQIWDNGKLKEAKILNAYATNVVLNNSANFYYSLYTETSEGILGEQLREGNIIMEGENYQLWQQDSEAWGFIASTLNLIIIDDFMPYIEPNIEKI